MEENKSIIVFTATHVKFDPPNNPVYVPLHVGREGKEDLGYLSDNIGIHISDLNYLFGELTGLFWIWQNVRNVDYIGLCHYRRYFLNDDKQPMRREEYLSLLEEYDVIVPIHAQCEGSYYRYYGNAHEAKYLDVIGDIIQRIYPEYYENYQKAMNGTIFYYGNLMVTSAPILKAYSEWLFTIFTEASDKIDVSGYDDYHKRIYGFLSEQMFYVYMMTNHLKYKEVQIGLSGEKAETVALKQQLKQLMAEERYAEAVELFQKEQEKRPDLLLPASDLYGELADILRQLKEKLATL